ncbi:MAG: DUF2283 domain-containing protein [Kiritimatiellae bacterium]|nr:DUF2283 domain-containing protein [Kiritimatiellia bacterium]
MEVRFSEQAGYKKATAHDAAMERVDAHGKVIGFSILGVSRFKKMNPLVAACRIGGNGITRTASPA